MSRTHTLSPAALSDEGVAPREAILCTAELMRRPSRPSDYERESRALAALAQALADSPDTILQTLADTILEVLQADSAGLSLLNEDGTRFHRATIAGAGKPQEGGGTPRDFGPDGDVLARDAALLFAHCERHAAYLLAAIPPAQEALVIPFFVRGGAVGIIWAMAREHRRRFDAEDLRQLESIGRFAAAAYQAAGYQQAMDSRRAALNLMEDAVRARELAEHLNEKLRREIGERERAEDALREKQRELASELADTKFLHRVSVAMAHEENVAAVYDEIMDAAVAIMHSDFASLQRLHPERGAPGSGGELHLLCFRGFNPEAARFWEWVRADSESTCAEALRTRQRAIAPDVQQCAYMAGSEDLKAYQQTGIHAVQTTPLVARDGRLIGMISTHWNKPHEPSERDLRVLDILARQAADVLELRIAEQALRESELRYRQIFQSAKDGILILDADTGLVRDANPFVGDLLQGTTREFVGKELWEIGLFADKAASDAAVREVRDHGYVRYDHLPVDAGQGRRIEVEVVANVYHEGQSRAIQANIRDTTDRSRLERQTREQAAALSDLHRRKDEFLAMLSHELRNPLAPIANAVHLLGLQRTSETELSRHAHGIIERQVGQLTRLVDDLLEVSRITTGRVSLRREPVALGFIVEQAVETVRPLVEQRRHDLTVILPPDPVWVYVDAGRMEQVVVNLLTNAAKYSEDAGRIQVSVAQEAETAVLRVRDTGVGIPPALLPRVFDLFTQAERSMARSEGGLGIGLSLVRRLVELHEGWVEAFSEPGKGSEFVVRLPVTRGAARQGPVPSFRAAPSGAPVRVLIVDDNVDAAESLASLLRAYGHVVRTMHDGPTAVEAALACRPDVVLLDIGLPGLDGFEIARRMRQQDSLRNVMLVALTGYGQETDRQRSKAAGFDGHLVKPAALEKVQALLALAAQGAASDASGGGENSVGSTPRHV